MSSANRPVPVSAAMNPVPPALPPLSCSAADRIHYNYAQHRRSRPAQPDRGRAGCAGAREVWVKPGTLLSAHPTALLAARAASAKTVAEHASSQLRIFGIRQRNRETGYYSTEAPETVMFMNPEEG